MTYYFTWSQLYFVIYFTNYISLSTFFIGTIFHSRHSASEKLQKWQKTTFMDRYHQRKVSRPYSALHLCCHQWTVCLWHTVQGTFQLVRRKMCLYQITVWNRPPPGMVWMIWIHPNFNAFCVYLHPHHIQIQITF